MSVSDGYVARSNTVCSTCNAIQLDNHMCDMSSACLIVTVPVFDRGGVLDVTCESLLSPGSTARQLSPTGPRQSPTVPTVPTGVNRHARHAPTALYHKSSTVITLVSPVKHCQAVKHPPRSRQLDSPTARQCPTVPDSARQLDSA